MKTGRDYQPFIKYRPVGCAILLVFIISLLLICNWRDYKQASMSTTAAEKPFEINFAKDKKNALTFFPDSEWSEGNKRLLEPFEGIIAIENKLSSVSYYFWHDFDKIARGFHSFDEAKRALKLYDEHWRSMFLHMAEAQRFGVTLEEPTKTTRRK